MSNEESRLADLLGQLTQQQLASLRRGIGEVAEKTAESGSPAVKLSMSVKIQDPGKTSPEALYAALAKQSGGNSPLDVKDVAALLQIQPKLVDWIRQSKENAALFATAPIAALRRSGIQLEGDLLDRLERLAAQAPRVGVGDLIEFSRIDLHAEDAAPDKDSTDTTGGAKEATI